MLSEYTYSQLFTGFAGALFWSIGYVLIICKSFRDKTYGVPFLAVCMNYAWELTFVSFPPHDAGQHIVHALWLTLDTCIVFTVLWFGPEELGWSPKQTIVNFLLTTTCSVAVILGLIYVYDDANGSLSAFTIDAVMAWLFVRMLFARQDLRGQSSDIAMSITIGSLAYCYLFYTISPKSTYLFYMYLLTISGNVIYFVLLQLMECVDL
jgi:hypothetical protein